MLSFENDYSEGAHPLILKKLADTNLEKLTGYGNDPYCTEAREKIAALCGTEAGDVYFLVGGTQTNEIIITAMLKPFEGVISPRTGHINVHEAGAIEANGHKVLALPEENGKLKAETAEQYLKDFYADGAHEHMVFPGMIYVSYPTEYGTLYTKQELKALHELAGRYGMTLYVDGARLGYGLMSGESDMSIKELAENCDVFYIGGTKVGALCGEAVVFTKHNMPRHFITFVKQRGAMLAKGRLLGIQFGTLFTDNLYFDISKKAIESAEAMKAAFKNKGYRFYIDSPTNQVFVILDNRKYAELSKKVRFSFWEKYDDNNTVVRFATSWATDIGEIKQLEEIL